MGIVLLMVVIATVLLSGFLQGVVSCPVPSLFFTGSLLPSNSQFVGSAERVWRVGTFKIQCIHRAWPATKIIADILPTFLAVWGGIKRHYRHK